MYNSNVLQTTFEVTLKKRYKMSNVETLKKEIVAELKRQNNGKSLPKAQVEEIVKLIDTGLDTQTAVSESLEFFTGISKVRRLKR